MLGPALADLLKTLAQTPARKRMPEQNALFKELALLSAVSKAPTEDKEYAALRAQLRKELRIDELGTFSITRPDPEASSGKCSCCGQRLP